MVIDFFLIGVSLAAGAWGGAARSGTIAPAKPNLPKASAETAIVQRVAPLGFCAASGGCDEYISRVQIGGIDQASACAGYEDRSGLWALVTPGKSYLLTVTNGNPVYPDDCCTVWVDWNQDHVWSPDERSEILTGVGPYQFTLTVPPAAVAGLTRLRIRIDWNNPDPKACGETTFGEVEDYSLLVTEGPLSGACCEAFSGVCLDDALSTECQAPGQQFYAETTCDALIPACGNPGACCSDVLAVCTDDVPELSCQGTRFAVEGQCAELDPLCGRQLFTFFFDPGTGPPPATVGGLEMLPLDPDPRPLFDDVTSILTPCPGGTTIGFSVPLNHRRIGAGWGWWSHGYSGDVYYTDGDDRVTLTVPPGTCALYFYVEPNTYSLESFELTVNDVVKSTVFSVHGASAAYVGVCGRELRTIRVTCTSGADFGLGEFGIACYCGVELCACCHEATGECTDDVDVLICAADPDARFIINGTCNQFLPPCGTVRGACCYGETCAVERPSECSGEYMGDNWPCRPNPCLCADTVVCAPGTWTGTTCGLHDICDMSSWPEVFYEVQIPHLGLWRIDLCESLVQVLLAFGETCCHTFAYEQGACGNQPYLERVLPEGNYFVTIEGWTGCGIYRLKVFELPWGACCVTDTALCRDYVVPEDCYGTHTMHEFCADLEPPCTGPLGACCDDASATCTETALTLCTGRFAPLTECTELTPVCGRWNACTHRIELYDSYGDGWTGNILDLYVNDAAVLPGLTLAAGAGPESYYFEAAHADEIRTEYHAHGGWPEEAFYVIISGREIVLVQDGDGNEPPLGVVIAGDCPEPCGDLDLDFDVDLYDYDFFFDCFGRCRGESGYFEPADLDHDGCIGMSDLELWLGCYEAYAD